MQFFLDKHQGKKIVVVQGLGFVGSVMSLVIANSDADEYAVIGIDLPAKQHIIDQINHGDFPIKSSDPNVYRYHEEARKKNNLLATTDPIAYSYADVVIVDINLDVEKGARDKFGDINYSVDLNGFKAAIKTIAATCKEDVLLLVETTVPPGTCVKVIKPIFEEIFSERGLPFSFKIGHSYERVMPGPEYINSIKNFYRVYSGIDRPSADAVEAFLRTIISTSEYPLTRLGSTNATEMAKVLENSFRAMNIAFIQEWTEFAEAAGVNLFEVIDAIRMRPTHKNIMRPGLGVGGYCLTKDPLLASWASQHLFNSIKLKQSEQAVQINDQMPLHTYRTIREYFGQDINGKYILILGISYLQNVGDTRFTPVEVVYDLLSQDGCVITLHDPYLSSWEEKELSLAETEVVLKRAYDAIVLGTPHDIYIKDNMLDKLLDNDRPIVVFDPHGAIPEGKKRRFDQHTYKIVGRGDV